MSEDTYLKALVAEEKRVLEIFLSAAIDAHNIVRREKILEINITTYKNYDKVLEIVYPTKKGYINIHMNSNLATARVLCQYIFDGGTKYIGFIEETYE